METERIELGENWWTVKKKLTIGAQRASEALSAPYFDKDLSPEAQNEAIPILIRLEMGRTMVLKSTAEWSYGPVTQEVFDNEVPDNDFSVVLQRCNELYSSVPLAVGS